MDYYKYLEQGDDGITPVEVRISKQEILDTYYEYWKSQMVRVGKKDQISEDSCVEDFIVIHWAWKDKNV